VGESKRTNSLGSGNPLLLSLFCGVGGLDLGFEKNGFQVGLAFDKRESSVSSYNENRKGTSAFVKNINSLTLRDLDDLYGRQFNPIGIIGGPPCQGFSISNVNKKKGDARNHLSYRYAELLDQLNRRSPVHFFVLENVKGLLSKKHKRTFEGIKARFEKVGFNVFASTLNAADYGAPQRRERLILVGLNKELYKDLDWQPPKPNRKSGDYKSVRTAIGGLPAPIFFQRDLKMKSASVHPNHWCMVPKSSKFFQKSGFKNSAARRSFRMLDWDEPSPTVAYGNREVHLHPSGKRRLSVFEAMLLQGFPRAFVLMGNMSQQFTQVSEAVPPPLSKALAKSIVSHLRLSGS